MVVERGARVWQFYRKQRLIFRFSTLYRITLDEKITNFENGKPFVIKAIWLSLFAVAQNYQKQIEASL